MFNTQIILLVSGLIEGTKAGRVTARLLATCCSSVLDADLIRWSVDTKGKPRMWTPQKCVQYGVLSNKCAHVTQYGVILRYLSIMCLNGQNSIGLVVNSLAHLSIDTIALTKSFISFSVVDRW